MAKALCFLSFVRPSVRPSVRDNCFAWRDNIMSVVNGGFPWNFTEIFIMWVGFDKRVFKDKSQRSRPWPGQLTYNGADMRFDGVTYVEGNTPVLIVRQRRVLFVERLHRVHTRNIVYVDVLAGLVPCRCRSSSGWSWILTLRHARSTLQQPGWRLWYAPEITELSAQSLYRPSARAHNITTVQTSYRS